MGRSGGDANRFPRRQHTPVSSPDRVASPTSVSGPPGHAFLPRHPAISGPAGFSEILAMTSTRSAAQPPPAEVGADSFEVTVVIHDEDDVVVSIRGEIDLGSAPRLWKALDEAIPETKQRFVIDLGNTAFVDSTALAVFVRAFKRLRHRGAELVLRSPRTNVRNVLHITGLDQVIKIEP